MKPFTSIALFALSSFLSVGTASAQDHAVQATVPFDFTVGSQPLPAGTYRITSVSSNIILIRNRDNPAIAMQSLTTNDGEEWKGNGKLVFHRYGRQYFLHEVECPAAAMSVDVPTSKLEKRVRMQEASLEHPTEVLLALK